MMWREIMEAVILLGRSGSGKTATLDRLYKYITNKEESTNKPKLVNNQIFEEKFSDETTDKRDHRVLLRGKDKTEKDINVVITSPGDNADELLKNVLFFFKSYLFCKNESVSIDYWLLSENTSHKKVRDYIGEFVELIKKYQLWSPHPLNIKEVNGITDILKFLNLD